MTSSAAKVIATCLLLSISMQMCCGSAIPIWEFLTRNEKMSYLYTTFAQLVSVHCKATAATSGVPVNECKRNLFAYGYEKLQTFSEDQLDALDPYQRGANELIWTAIMKDHSSSVLITTRKPILSTPPATSLIILTHQIPRKEESAATLASSLSTSTSSEQIINNKPEQQQQHFGQNPIFNEDKKNKYAMGMDMAYGYAEQQAPHTQQQSQEAQSRTYLTGPLVFRVRPDGTPVEEDQYKPLPKDDDLDTYAMTPVPTVSKHRKIATISALKERSMGVVQYLQPPYESSQRMRRQPAAPTTVSFNPSRGYFYGRGIQLSIQS